MPQKQIFYAFCRERTGARVKNSSENIDLIKTGEAILFSPAKMTILIDSPEEHLPT